MTPSPIWIKEAEVVAQMDLSGAIAALEAGLRLQAQERAHNMNKAHAIWPTAQMHAIGAIFDDAQIACAKSWIHTPGGATPLLALWNTVDGSLLAVIEAFALGQMRTGGISGVATRYMSREDSACMALIGTGKQALAQLAAVAAVRPLKTVRIWGRDRAKLARFADAVAALGYDFAIETPPTVAEAAAGADVITLVTRAREPFLTAAMAAPGAHINAVGAITPEREEFTQDVLARADLIAADDPLIARGLSQEFGKYLAAQGARADFIRPLCRVIVDAPVRAKARDLTVFKAMGMGISDLALGVEIYQRALSNGIGREIERPEKVAPRLR